MKETLREALKTNILVRFYWKRVKFLFESHKYNNNKHNKKKTHENININKHNKSIRFDVDFFFMNNTVKSS